MADLTPYVYAKDYQAGSEYGIYGWTTCDEGKRGELTGGYKYNSNNWVLALKFTMPDNAESITLGFFTISGANNGYDSNIRYKVSLTEDDAAYINATSETAGDGDFTVKNPSARTELTISGFFAKGETYYIYFWTAEPTDNVLNLFRVKWESNEDDDGFYADYELASVVRIDVGDSIVVCTAYIEDGSSWHRCLTNVEDGSTFELCR